MKVRRGPAFPSAIRQGRARDVVGTAALNVAVVVIGSVGGLFLARFLGPTHRGDLVTILQWPITIGTLAGFGVVQATCYWLARDPKRAAAYASTAAVAACACGVLVALCGLPIASRIGRNHQVVALLALVLAMTPIYLGSRVWISALQATNIRRWNALRAVQPSTYLTGVVGLSMLAHLTLTTVVAAYALSLVAEAIAAATVYRATVGTYHKPQVALLVPLYSFGSKVWLSSLPQTVNVSVDQLVLSVAIGVTAAQLGNYAVAVSLSWLALPAAIAFGSVALPRIPSIRGAPALRRIENTSMVGAGVVAFLAITTVAILAPFVVPKVFGPGYQDSIMALWLLSPGTVLLAVNRVLGDLLQGRGHPLTQSIGEGVGALVTISLLLLLIPVFGIRGAAVASSSAYGVTFLVLVFGLQHIRREHPDGIHSGPEFYQVTPVDPR